jgi:hypothetical protein
MANRHRFRYWCERITTKENVIADALSRFKPVNRNLQDPKFGLHNLSHKFTFKEVILSIQRVLGELWNPNNPPQGFKPVPLDFNPSTFL